MSIPDSLNKNLALPVICAPMFIISNPDLVIAQCKSGIIGSFPALNARPKELLDEWLTRIKSELGADPKAAPFAVNQIIHPSNERLEHDMALCVKHEVPLIITSLSAPGRDRAACACLWRQGFPRCDQRTPRRKGAGGRCRWPDPRLRRCRRPCRHPPAPSRWSVKFASSMMARLRCRGRSPTASPSFLLRPWGPICAYIGTRFIATQEANAVEAYKQAIIDSSAKDVVYTPYFTGVHGNYLSKSIVAAGLDPANLPERDKSSMNFGGSTAAKAWKDIWGAGQGVGTIDEVMPNRRSGRPPQAGIPQRQERAVQQPVLIHTKSNRRYSK